jgi:hypothetical protein
MKWTQTGVAIACVATLGVGAMINSTAQADEPNHQQAAQALREQLKIERIQFKSELQTLRASLRAASKGMGTLPSQNRMIARSLASSVRGWRGRQWTCLDNIWRKESGYAHTVWNHAGSGAYGIPQSLPASKMSSAGPDWLENPATQVLWGLGYIGGRYGTPCRAWVYWQANGHY